MSEDIIIEAGLREESGSGPSGRLRKAGWLPAVVNDEDGASHAIRLNMHDFELLLHHHAGEHLLVDLRIDGQRVRKCLLQDVQHDPVTGGLLHADFHEISMTEKIAVTVPIEVVGEAVGVKMGGGVLEQLLREVEIECLPGNLPEQLTMDVSALEIGDSLQVGDLQVGDKVTLLTSPDIAVVSVSAPRLEEPSAEAEEEEAAEGEEAEEGAGEEGASEEAEQT